MLNNDRYKDVNLGQLDLFLQRLPSRCDIRFIGAEPTMHPQLTELIRTARKNGHRPSLLTNGLKLKQESYVKGLKDAGLNMLGISMNGGLDNDVYMDFDGGPYARAKMMALENCFKYKILPHINVIIDPTNIHIVKPLAEYIKGLGYMGPKFPVMLRLKSIGQMGYYRKTHTYTLKEMLDIIQDMFEVEIISNVVDGYWENRSVVWKTGSLLGKITDWSVDDDGVPDPGSGRRGIITEDWKISPFFEYYAREHERLSQD